MSSVRYSIADVKTEREIISFVPHYRSCFNGDCSKEGKWEDEDGMKELTVWVYNKENKSRELINLNGKEVDEFIIAMQRVIDYFKFGDGNKEKYL